MLAAASAPRLACEPQADGLQHPPRDPGQARRARRLHREGDRAARARAPAVLRPPPRERAHQLGRGRNASQGVGGAARRDAAARRSRRAPALRAAQGARRAGRQQPGDGDHPRAPRAQGARTAQRPPERVFDRRELSPGAHDPPLRQPGAEGRAAGGHDHRDAARRLRADRARSRQRRHLARDARRARRQETG